ncbi:MASE3 domain-containing protein [Arcobacteraceae bacterium]|nr:MASE3 domain-containing protein [Arcobacteraceae bacterium]
MSIVKKRNIYYLLTIITLSIFFIISRDIVWRGSTTLHTIMEVIATILAIIIGISSLVRFHAKRDEVLFLFIGAGFLGTGFLDGYHATVTSEFFKNVYPSPPESLIPWSWVASRLYLSIFFFIAYYKWKIHQDTNTNLVYFITFITTISVFLFFALVPLPSAYYPNLFFHRPEEFLPAVFFGIALYGFYTKGEWKKNIFEHWLILSLIVNFLSQVLFMSFSVRLFDFGFDIAHLLKKLSYIAVLIGVYLSMLASFKREVLLTNNLNREINNTTKALNKSKEDLQKLNTTLEHRIKEELKKNIEQERQIFEQSKLASMGEMIGNIAHQWRQPLSVIATGATGMQMQNNYNLLNKEMIDTTCDSINRNAQYLSNTIDDFRNYIKGDSVKKVFSLTKEITSFLHLIDSTIKSVHINVILNLKDDIMLCGYPNELIQCLINLFNNSKDVLTILESERLIFVSTFIENKNVIISFKDNAGGIPEEILPKIFEPYFTTKHKSQGTGLGLHMTYNLIVDGMNGTIMASTVTYNYEDNEYTGVEFIISLPIS